MKRVLITGQTFGRLTVLSDEPSVEGKAFVTCQCECGKVFTTMSQSVRRGLTKSCGCLQQEKLTQGLRLKHGGADTAEYKVWKDIKARCFNPNRKSFKDYGARNITMCDEWRNDFSRFLADMGTRPSPLHSIERLDNNGNYCPENCIWATRVVQNNNTTQNRNITWNGETHTLAEWCRMYDMPYARTQSRIYLGWTLEQALFIPCTPGQKVKRKSKSPAL